MNDSTRYKIPTINDEPVICFSDSIQNNGRNHRHFSIQAGKRWVKYGEYYRNHFFSGKWIKEKQ